LLKKKEKTTYGRPRKHQEDGKERDTTRNLMRNEVQVCQTHIMLRSKEKETTGNFISFVF